MIYVVAACFFLVVLIAVLAYAKGRTDEENQSERTNLEAAKNAEEFRADSYSDLGKPEFLDWLRHDPDKSELQVSPPEDESEPSGSVLRVLKGGRKKSPQ